MNWTKNPTNKIRKKDRKKLKHTIGWLKIPAKLTPFYLQSFQKVENCVAILGKEGIGMVLGG